MENVYVLAIALNKPSFQPYLPKEYIFILVSCDAMFIKQKSE